MRSIRLDPYAVIWPATLVDDEEEKALYGSDWNELVQLVENLETRIRELENYAVLRTY